MTNLFEEKQCDIKNDAKWIMENIRVKAHYDYDFLDAEWFCITVYPFKQK
jgi:hypothetical protein